MHNIRSKARRQAWYLEDQQNGRFNPFGRLQASSARRRTHDTEANHNEGASPAYEVPISRLQHAATEPIDVHHRVKPGSDLAGDEIPHAQDDENIVYGTPWRRTTQPNGVDEPVPDDKPEPNVTDDATSSEGTKPRKRKFFRPFGPIKKDSDLDDTLGEIMTDDTKRKPSPKFTLASQFRVLLGAWSTLLFAFVPAGFAVNYTHQSPITIFIVNFFAIIPSNVTLGFAIEQVLMYVGNASGGLISMSFGNAAQLITSILLLKQGQKDTSQILVLQSSLIGTMLQNLLLMTGLSFFLGGLNRTEQYFNTQVAQTMGMFLLLAVLSLTIPTVSRFWGHSVDQGIIEQSRGTAVVIIVSYALWLLFQLRTHRELFSEPTQLAPKRKTSKKEHGEVFKGFAFMGATSGATAGGVVNQENLVQEEDDEDEAPQLSLTFAIASMIFFTALLAFNTQYATDSIQGVMTLHNVSSSFMGIVVLPILSNDPLSIDSAVKDRMGISLALTLERCMQTSLMVIPLIVLIAWGLNIDSMTLDFDGFSVAALFASIIIVTYVVQEGKSNWLTGALLVKVYVIIALASYFNKDLQT
ncbi:Hypothetical protein R9X50_00285800 [Acrodontium crateriforme]|uniref:Sodium/calcium exchanger membrane region domain-containing protein n=1 Tax=Acrodontium crateriforme TaxID=150365 RepID=A0AAQ3M3B6_9PEZI|nr:Hypothetical protein R9X50_00285800 [Acrodontium crateriforme]